jgi:integrase
MRDHFASFRLGLSSEWILHHRRSARQLKKGDRIRDMRRPDIRAGNEARLPGDFRRHDLRHRRVKTWLSVGKPIHLVQKAMGHSDIRTTLRYEHLVATDLLQLVEELPKRAVAVGTD